MKENPVVTMFTDKGLERMSYHTAYGRFGELTTITMNTLIKTEEA